MRLNLHLISCFEFGWWQISAAEASERSRCSGRLAESDGIHAAECSSYKMSMHRNQHVRRTELWRNQNADRFRPVSEIILTSVETVDAGVKLAHGILTASKTASKFLRGEFAGSWRGVHGCYGQVLILRLVCSSLKTGQFRPSPPMANSFPSNTCRSREVARCTKRALQSLLEPRY